MLFEQNCASSNGLGVILQRICAIPRFFGRLLQFGVDLRIVLGRSTGRLFIWIRVLREKNRHRKKGSANRECHNDSFHLRAPNNRPTIEPNPVISRETPHRIRNR